MSTIEKTEATDLAAEDAAARAELERDAHALLVADAHPGSLSVPLTFAGWCTYDQARGIRLAFAARALPAKRAEVTR